MSKPTNKILAFGALLGTTALTTPAYGQSAGLVPPPVFQKVDGNDVAIQSGKIVKTLASISIGPGGPGSLGFDYSTDSSDQQDILGYVGFCQNCPDSTKDTASVTIGGSTETFTSPHGAYTFTQNQGRASTLTYNSGANTYTYTGADGTVSVFSTVLVSTVEWGITSLTYPSGEQLHYYYGTDAPGYTNVHAVTSSLGYQLRLTWSSSGWVNSAVVFNMNSETCDPTATSCTLVGSWPTLTWDYPNSRVVDSTGKWVGWTADATHEYFTYPSGRTLTYTGGSGPNGGPFVVGSFTDGKGTWQYAYATGVTYIVNPEGTRRVVTWSPTSGVITSDQPDANKSLKAVYGYDSSNRITSVKKTDGTLTSETDYAYDARGNLNLETQVSTTPGTPANIVTSAVFPSTCANVKTCNKSTSITDALGNTTNYTYDPNSGGLASVTFAAAPNGTHPQTRYTYTQVSANYRNGSGGIISGSPVWKLTATSACQTQSSCGGSADEVKTTATYDPNQSLLPVSISKGAGDGSLTATTSMTYTGNGDVNSTDGPLAGSADTSRYYYDSMRRPLGSVGPAPGNGQPMRALRITYDSDARAATKEIGTAAGQGDSDLANMTSFQQQVTDFDAQGRPVMVELNAGGTTYSLTQMSYSTAGVLSCQAVRMNPATFGSPPVDACTLGPQGSYGPDRITSITHDSYFRTTSVTSGFGTSGALTDVTDAYDSLGRLASVKDANGNMTAYSYDGMNRLSSTCFADSGSDCETLGYDASNNVISRRLRDGATTLTYTYDALDRLRTKTLPEGTVTYGYDNLGHTTSITEGSTTLSFTYDNLGRNLTQVGPQGTVTSAWDLDGRRTSIAYPSASGASNLTVGYNHLTTGEVSSIVDGATSLASYAYDNLGNRQRVTYGNGVVTSYGYDVISRLTSLTADLAGTANDLTQTFTYNPASEIATVSRSNNAYAFPTAQIGNVNRGYMPNVLNQYASVAGATFGYDAKGNLAQSPGAGTTNYYCYDSENRLVKGAASAACTNPSTTLAYDPSGRIGSVSTSAATTNFAYDGLNLIAEYTGSTLKNRYVFGPALDEPIVTYDISGNRSWLISDERGSIIASTDAVGNKSEILSYDEYGIPASSNTGRFQYTGQVYLPELGMYYYKARMYSTTLGRFMQSDLIGYGDGINWYAYSHDDPVNGTDPTGTTCDGIGYATCSSDTINGSCEGGPLDGSDCNAIKGAVDVRYDPSTGDFGQYYYNSAGDIYWQSNGTNVSDYASLIGGSYEPDLGTAAQFIHSGLITPYAHITYNNTFFEHVMSRHTANSKGFGSKFSERFSNETSLEALVDTGVSKATPTPSNERIGRFYYIVVFPGIVGTDLGGDPTSIYTIDVFQVGYGEDGHPIYRVNNMYPGGPTEFGE